MHSRFPPGHALPGTWNRIKRVVGALRIKSLMLGAIGAGLLLCMYLTEMRLPSATAAGGGIRHTQAAAIVVAESKTSEADRPPATHIVHYCVIHPADLLTPHARCFNASRATHEQNRHGRWRNKDAKPAEAQSAASHPARYPCLPIELRFDSLASMHAELGVSSEDERTSTILVVRGDGRPETAASSSSPPPAPGDTARLAAFLRQYARVMTPKVTFPSGADPNEPFREQYAERMRQDPEGMPAYAKGPPEIARQDLLLFHDRLSWTLFVQSISGPDGDRRPAAVAARCPLNTAQFGGDHIFGRKKQPFDRPITTTASCLPHHELLFGRMGRMTKGAAEAATAPRVAHTSYSCDGHASARALLVPRSLFHSAISEMACRPPVHSMLDLFLEVQDDNEHRNLMQSMQSRASSASTPAPSSSAWSTLGPDGRTAYWNANKDFWLINSQKAFVDPAIYMSEQEANEGDVHEDYPALEEAEERDAEEQQSRRSEVAPIRVLCTSLVPEVILPARPALHPRSPAFHHLHRNFPPSPAYLEASLAAASGGGGSLPPDSLVSVPNPQDLKTFLQPQRNINLASWSRARFEGWVDVQRQGRFICSGCVLRWDYCRYVAGKVMHGQSEQQHAYWAHFDYLSCALAGDANQWQHTVRGQYLEQDGYIAKTTAKPYTALESRSALERRRIRRVVYSDLHVSWHGCVPSSQLCCNGNHPLYPLSCRNVRRDTLWIQNAPCCLRHVISIYHYVVTLFSKHNVEWALGFGTLLSALRSDGGMNPYDYDIDLLVYMRGYSQVKALIPLMESEGYAVIFNYDKHCTHDCYLYRIVHQSPDHIHQSTLDIFLQDETDRPAHPFNVSMHFLGREAIAPFDAQRYLDTRYPGWRDTQIMSVENWLWDPVLNVMPKWLKSSLRMEKRAFNRSMELVTLPPWARKLHLYAEWDLTRAGVDRRDEQAPTIEIVWRPEQMDLK